MKGVFLVCVTYHIVIINILFTPWNWHIFANTCCPIPRTESHQVRAQLNEREAELLEWRSQFESDGVKLFFTSWRTCTMLHLELKMHLNFLLSTGSLQARQFLWCGLCGLCWHNGLVQTKKQHQTTRLEWIDVVSACCLSIGFYRTGWMYGFLLFFQCLPRSLDSYESGSLSSLDSGCDVLV